MHVNLPFSGDREFARLHAAIQAHPADPAGPRRQLAHRGRGPDRLPRLPHRLLPQPLRAHPQHDGSGGSEAVHSQAEYRERILEPMYREIAPLDEAQAMQDSG
jgi:hypothetical protein